MPYKDLRTISEGILGESSSTTFEKKVLLVMYYSELLALNFKEIDAIFQTNTRERLFNIFYLDASFVEHVYVLFLNSEIDTIMPKIFDRLIRIQELLHQREMLKSCKTSGIVQ